MIPAPKLLRASLSTWQPRKGGSHSERRIGRIDDGIICDVFFRHGTSVCPALRPENQLPHFPEPDIGAAAAKRGLSAKQTSKQVELNVRFCATLSRTGVSNCTTNTLFEHSVLGYCVQHSVCPPALSYSYRTVFRTPRFLA